MRRMTRNTWNDPKLGGTGSESYDTYFSLKYLRLNNKCFPINKVRQFDQNNYDIKVRYNFNRFKKAYN